MMYKWDIFCVTFPKTNNIFFFFYILNAFNDISLTSLVNA